MRARNIKPGFFENDELAELPFEGRLLFIGLWCLADKEGRLEDKPRKIKGIIFPFDDNLTVNSPLNNGDPTVMSLLDGLEHRGFIRRYTVNKQKYILIENFRKHQHPHHTEKNSEIPGPNETPETDKSVLNSNYLEPLTVNSPLNNGENPSDSLIPDSLIPDCGMRNNTSCSEPSFEAPEQVAATEAFLTITTNKKGVEYPVMEAQISEFQACYPAVDVRQEIRKMRAWALTHLQQRKTYGGMPKFINGWLSREQDKGVKIATQRDPPTTVLTRQGQHNLRVAEAYLERMGPTCKTE